MQKVTNIKQIKKKVNKNREIIIYKEGKSMITIMEEYKNKKLNEDIEKHLLKAEQDIENGKVREAGEVFEHWKAKYEI